MEYLVDRYLDCRMSDVEKRELETMVIEFPQARSMFWNQTRIHGLIRTLASESVGHELARAQEEPVAEARPRRSRVRRILRRRVVPASWKVAAIAAGLLIAVGVWGLVMGIKSEANQDVIASLKINGSEAVDIEPGEHVELPNGFGAVVTYRDEKTRITLAPGSRAKFDIVNGAKIIKLWRGRVDCTIAPQPDKSPFLVMTPHAQATVLGTVFCIDVNSSRSRLEVTESAVQLMDRWTHQTVVAESGWFAEVGPQIQLIAGLINPPADKPPVILQPEPMPEPEPIIQEPAPFIEPEPVPPMVEPKPEPVPEPVEPAPEPAPKPVPEMAVVSFTLINADTDRPIEGYDPLVNGTVINLSELPTRNLNIRANVAGTLQSVRFVLNRGKPKVENVPPYAMAGDGSGFNKLTGFNPTAGDYNPWTPDVGDYFLTATPCSKYEGRGEKGRSFRITLTVIDEPSS
jgi:hypothetical protein